MSATWDAGFNAPVTEPVAEACIREGASPLVHEKGEITARRGVYDLLQGGQDRQRKPFGFPVAPLVLGEGELAVFRMLFAEPNNVRPALAREQHQSEREPRFRSDWMPRLELPHFFGRPSVKT